MWFYSHWEFRVFVLFSWELVLWVVQMSGIMGPGCRKIWVYTEEITQYYGKPMRCSRVSLLARFREKLVKKSEISGGSFPLKNNS